MSACCVLATTLKSNVNPFSANVFCLITLAMLTTVFSDESLNEDDESNEWMEFYSENGSIYMMNFSSIPDQSRGMFFGDAYFNLYTRKNPNDPEEIEIPENGGQINSSYFNPSNNLKVVTHGWISSDKSEWLQNIRDYYLKMYDYNVITVDWSEIASNPSYVWPALSTRYVGKRVAKLLESLMQTYNITGSNVHLIGHSLGAQVMGYAGMFSKQPISRVTGLDPARPLFEFPYMPPKCRLEKSDAEFVDIIHTCGGVYGYRMSHGHADFYPNGGRAAQPGCRGMQPMIQGCSHGRACEFYGESILTGGFTSYPCENWKKFENGECKNASTEMGDPVSTESRGDYYLHTNSESKYSKGDEQNSD